MKKSNIFTRPTSFFWKIKRRVFEVYTYSTILMREYKDREESRMKGVFSRAPLPSFKKKINSFF
jgi:hypothetical protein